MATNKTDRNSTNTDEIIDVQPIEQASEAQDAAHGVGDQAQDAAHGVGDQAQDALQNAFGSSPTGDASAHTSQEFGSHTAQFMKQKSVSSPLQQVESFEQPPSPLSDQNASPNAPYQASGNSPYGQQQPGYVPYGNAPQYGTPYQQQQQPEKKSRTGLVVGIVIGAVCLCCICCVGGMVFIGSLG